MAGHGAAPATKFMSETIKGTLDVFAPDDSLARRIFLLFKKFSHFYFRGPGFTEWTFTAQETNTLRRLDDGTSGQSRPGWD